MKASVENWLKEQFGDDKVIMSEVWNEYFKSVEEKIPEAREALAAGDYPLLDRIAHTLKGNGLMVGDQEAADAAIRLRDASKISDGAGCAAAIEEIVAFHELDRKEFVSK